MTRRSILTLVIAGCLPLLLVPARAQLPTYRVTWDIAAASAADAMGFDYALSIDGANTLLTGVICTQLASGSTITCSAPLPAMSSGAHTLAIVASNAFGTATSDPLSGNAPGKPGNVKVRR